MEKYGDVNLYLRPIVYLSGDCEGKQEYFTSTNVDIHACKIDTSVLNIGNKAIISSYVRSYPEYNMQVKCAGNYDKIYAMYAEAKRSKSHHALVSDKNGYIVESATANIFIQRGKNIFTPPDNGSILPGITRQLVMDILSDPLILSRYNIDCCVKEKNLTRSDLYTADSIFLTGTMCEILAIHFIDGKEVDCAENKPYYQMILQGFTKLTRQIEG